MSLWDNMSQSKYQPPWVVLKQLTADGIWVSPHIYAVTTKADIQTIADDAKVIKGSTNWHLGYGADLQVGYQLTSCLKLGIYSV